MIIKNCNVLTDNECIINAFIEIEEGRIKSISREKEVQGGDDRDVINAEKCYVAPGFIDSHTHGGFGHDYSDIALDELLTVLASLPKYGTTSVLPTIGSTNLQNLTNMISMVKSNFEQISSAGARFLGFHLEGPFLNKVKKGAQPEQFILTPNLKTLREIIELSEGLVKIVTIAPELEGAFELIDYLVKNDITVSVGHSNADGDTVIKAFDVGARRVTHLYNCMSPLHHRSLGVAGAALYCDDIFTELVLDGYHVDPRVANITYKVKGPDQLILVTDSTKLVGLPEGEYTRPDGRPVIYKDGSVRMSNGILAGSVLTLDQAFRNAVKMLDVEPITASKLTSTNAAKSIGLDNLGVVSEGKKADLVILNHEFAVIKTIINGEIRFLK